jgi:hypothetical protein
MLTPPRYMSGALNENINKMSTKSNRINRNCSRLLPVDDRQMDKSDYFTRYESVDNNVIEAQCTRYSVSLFESSRRTAV